MMAPPDKVAVMSQTSHGWLLECFGKWQMVAEPMAREPGPEQMVWTVPSTTPGENKGIYLKKDLLNVSPHKGLQ